MQADAASATVIKDERTTYKIFNAFFFDCEQPLGKLAKIGWNQIKAGMYFSFN